MKRWQEYASKNWFGFACISLGCFLTCAESDRFTTLLVVQSQGYLTAIYYGIAIVLLAFTVLFLLNRMDEGLNLCENRALLIVVMASFIAKALLQFTPLGSHIPAQMYGASIKTLQTVELVAFLALGELLMRAGAKQSVTAFAVGMVIAGSFQLVLSVLPRYGAVFLLLLIAALVVPYLQLAYRGFMLAQEPPADDAIEPNVPRGLDLPAQDVAVDKSSFTGLWIMVVLLCILFGGIHNLWLPYQDGGTASMVIQLSAGLGTMLCGNLILLLRNRLRNTTAFDLCKNLVLPVTIGALYFASLIDSGQMVFAYIVPLNIAQKATLLLVWAAPFFYRTTLKPMSMFCIGVVAYHMGRVLRMFLNSVPDSGGDFAFSTLVLATAMFGLLFVAAFSLYKTRVTSHDLIEVAHKPEVVEVRRPFMDSCQELMEEAQLTPREGEIFVLLAKGRSAQYVAKRLTVSVPTARSHIAHIYQKLGVSSQQQLMDLVDLRMSRD
ncbi:MAG: helix-turn-helix transcriptional regulator [Coriobacteriales bacterium]|nr:helix-turn-helix transcriptional regulator [Coriobacteriales bacterium]